MCGLANLRVKDQITKDSEEKPLSPYALLVVGVTRFERATPCSQGRCATKLRYTPICSLTKAIVTK